MEKERRNIALLRAIIALAAVTLVIIVVVGIRSDREKTSILGESGGEKESGIKKEEMASEPLLTLPPLKKIEEEFSKEETTTEGVSEEEREKPSHEVMMLKDLPVDLVAFEEQGREEEIPKEGTEKGEEKKSLDSQPSPEEMKMLKEKGLIIY